MANPITEDHLEKAAIKLLKETYGYNHINCMTAMPEDLNDSSKRSSKKEVIFKSILLKKLKEFNETIPESAIQNAIDSLSAKRFGVSALVANKEIYNLIRNGIPVSYLQDGKELLSHLTLIDFSDPEKNEFTAVSQLWIQGDRITRRPDILIYINGIPLVFIELKNANVSTQNAYNDNLTNYKADIPQLFYYNAFCILSNGIETKVGSHLASYEYFFNWLRPDDEEEKVNREQVSKDGSSLERVLHGLLPKNRLLDYIENFILYYKNTVKIIAQNHQFIGVNRAIESFKSRENKKGRLGVFWHTQGSGKSYSMIFLSQKVFRKFGNHFTFLIITDRDDLDSQIYRNFLDTEAVQNTDVARPKDSKEMRNFLGQNLRIVFSLIHKFRYDKGQDYPILSERKDIIVIVDEAHRTQYADLAANMRKGLPGAQYFAFTGTPILGKGDARYKGITYDWFGDYVSQYNFSQSVDDGATVPLYYQKRVPEVLNQNSNLDSEFYDLIENDNVEEKYHEKLEKEFAAELQIIKRSDRLETIAKDIVEHFPSRGYMGKGMVISIDKFTCVRMYEFVKKHWDEKIKALVGEVSKETNEFRRAEKQKQLEFMRSVEMAVVVSKEAGEEEKFKKHNLDIKSHRDKLNTPDPNGQSIEDRFKKDNDNLKLVFVCSMWLTGFDAPTVSTLYLDKPMKDHTLMQTIARANRVTSFKINGKSKMNGEIIDYFNVFRNMKQALKDFGKGSSTEEAKDVLDDSQVQEKAKLFELLDAAVSDGLQFCKSLDINLHQVFENKEVFHKVQLFDAFANQILAKDEFWKEFKVYENTISSLYESARPEILSDSNDRRIIAVFSYLRGVIDGILENDKLDEIKAKISRLLDQSIITKDEEQFFQKQNEAYSLRKIGKIWDLSKINYEKLKEEFKDSKHKNIEITDLRQFIQKKLDDMLSENSSRILFMEKMQSIIEKYNSGGASTENYYDELVQFAEDLTKESERHVKEGLTPDELEIFDLLKKEKMTKDEEIKVKNAAKHLLHRLIEEQPKVLIQDWYKDSQTQAQVKSEVEKILDKDLPETYDRALFANKTNLLFQLIFDYSQKGIKWAA